jgi:hypothetical protein
MIKDLPIKICLLSTVECKIIVSAIKCVLII